MSIRTRFDIRFERFRLDVDLQLPPRGVTAIFGRSGSGKTTFLRALAGLDRHPEGLVKVGDEIWQDGETFLPVHRRSVGYVFQEASLFPHLSVRQNLEYGLRRSRGIPSRSVQQTIDRVVSMVGLEELLDRMPDTLSGGERQRVAIGRSLATQPRILLMDEPLSSLDEGSKDQITRHLEALLAELEIPVVYVSHSLSELTTLGHHLVVLDDGVVVAEGPINDVLTRLDLPLSKSRTAESVLEARIVEHDETYSLTMVETPAGRFQVDRLSLEVGATVRLKIAARDVSLAIEAASGSSILNVVTARVDDIVFTDGAHAIVRLKAGYAPLLARITRKSAARLGIEPGLEVFAQVKSVAVEV